MPDYYTERIELHVGGVGVKNVGTFSCREVALNRLTSILNVNIARLQLTSTQRVDLAGLSRQAGYIMRHAESISGTAELMLGARIVHPIEFQQEMRRSITRRYPNTEVRLGVWDESNPFQTDVFSLKCTGVHFYQAHWWCVLFSRFWNLLWENDTMAAFHNIWKPSYRNVNWDGHKTAFKRLWRGGLENEPPFWCWLLNGGGPIRTIGNVEWYREQRARIPRDANERGMVV